MSSTLLCAHTPHVLASELGQKKEMENPLEICLVDHCAFSHPELLHSQAN